MTMTHAELRQEIAETVAGLREIRASFADMRAAQVESDQRLAAAKLESEQRMEAERRKTEAAQLKMSAEVDKLSREIRNYIGNDAETVEDYFYRTLRKSYRLGGVKYNDIGRHVQLHDQAPEFDVVLYNATHVAVVEVKKKAHVAEVDGMGSCEG